MDNPDQPYTPALRALAWTILIGMLGGLCLVGVHYSIPSCGIPSDRSLVLPRIKKLEKAVKSYYIDHGTYPVHLAALLSPAKDGSGPYIEDLDDLVDPWGQAFGYDPNATDPDGIKRPRIFSESPQGIDPQDGEAISNFK